MSSDNSSVTALFRKNKVSFEQSIFGSKQSVLVCCDLDDLYLKQRVLDEVRILTGERRPQESIAHKTTHLLDLIMSQDTPDNIQQKGLFAALTATARAHRIYDVVIDFNPITQTNINRVLRKGRDLFDADAGFRLTLLNHYRDSAGTSPMDNVLAIASLGEMRVKALNSGLAGLASFFRQAKGLETVPAGLATQAERFGTYMLQGFDMDVELLNHFLRRDATDVEQGMLKSVAYDLLIDQPQERWAMIFEEASTAAAIDRETTGLPFIGFFESSRIFGSPETGRGLYAELVDLMGANRLVTITIAGAKDPAAEQADYLLTRDMRLVPQVTLPIPGKGFVRAVPPRPAP